MNLRSGQVKPFDEAHGIGVDLQRGNFGLGEDIILEDELERVLQLRNAHNAERTVDDGLVLRNGGEAADAFAERLVFFVERIVKIDKRFCVHRVQAQHGGFAVRGIRRQKAHRAERQLLARVLADELPCPVAERFGIEIFIRRKRDMRRSLGRRIACVCHLAAQRNQFFFCIFIKTGKHNISVHRS